MISDGLHNFYQYCKAVALMVYVLTDKDPNNMQHLCYFCRQYIIY